MDGEARPDSHWRALCVSTHLTSSYQLLDHLKTFRQDRRYRRPFPWGRYELLSISIWLGSQQHLELRARDRPGQNLASQRKLQF